MTIFDWLRANYGLEAKRTEYIWVVGLVVFAVVLVTVGPVVYGWFK